MGEQRFGWRSLAFGLGAAVVVALALYVATDASPDGEAPPETPTEEPPPETPAEEPSRAPAVLAPEGYVVQNLDHARSAVLHLGLVGRDGSGFICSFGEPRSDTPPLLPVTCTTAEAAALHEPPRGLFGTPQIVGDRTYETDDAGQLVARGDEASVVVSPLPPAPERVEVCETTGVQVVAVDGDLIHGVRETLVAFVGPSSLLGAATVRTEVYAYHFACRPEEARLTWLSVAARGDAPILVVHQAVCDHTSCERIESRLARSGTDPMVASIAGQVLLVYATDAGTRMRLAPITRIATAQDLDVPPDPDAPILSRSLFARGGAAIVTLRSTLGVHALRVDTTGAVRHVSEREP